MFSWRKHFRKRERASDHPVAKPPRPARDRALEAAIAKGAIHLVYQPQIDPATGDILGAEALARWSGVASAEALFSRAAAAGLSERLSRHVQRRALQCAARWSGPPGALNLSINLLPQDVLRE